MEESRLHLLEIPPEEEIEAFRIVRVAERSNPDLIRSFRSHYESGLRPQPIEARHSAIHMAVSFWSTVDQAEALAKRFPVIGDHVAHVRLIAGKGFDYLDPSMDRPGHITVWGDKLLMAQSVVDIVPVK